MTEIERLTAVQAIRQVKARYFRGVDTGNGDLVRGILAEDCVLDYRGCCTDPTTGIDYLPAMNVILTGRASWMSDGMARFGIISVHQGHDADIVISDDGTATGIWTMTDRLWFPPGGEIQQMTGYGHYHETYVEVGGTWLLKSTKITRILVEVS